MGSAAARALATSGRRTLLLERFAIGHDRGSSHGPARIFRLSYPDPEYVTMAQRALPMWHAAEAEAGEPLLRTTGGLDLGAAVAAHADALGASAAGFELLDPSEARTRFGIEPPGDGPVLFQPDAGVLSADRAWRAFARLAAKHGAEVRERASVRAVESLDDRVEVRLDGGRTETAGVVVVTAGAWARDLLGTAGIGLDVRPTRETVGYFSGPDHVPAIVEWAEPAVYALSAGDGTLRAGLHRAGPALESGADARGAPDAAALEALGRWLRERIPGADPAPVRAETCLYTSTADERFVLERHGRIVVGSACSGHGFKFAPLIGERLAELAAEAG